MSSRMFQGVVLQMKDSIDRTVGVIDADGIVVACSELTCIGEHWSGAVTAVNSADHAAAHFEDKTFRPLAGWGAQFDYAAFVQGEDETAAALCSMAVVAFNGAKAYYEEKHDKATFVKNIISDNILLGDIYTQAKELHFVSEAPRAAFLVRQLGPADVTTIDVIQGLFPDKQTDFVISINETDVALIKQLPEGPTPESCRKSPNRSPLPLPRNWVSKWSSASEPWSITSEIWPAPIRRPGWLLTWVRSLRMRRPLLTMKTWASAV